FRTDRTHGLQLCLDWPLAPHRVRRRKSRVATIGVASGPVRRDPAGPADLPAVAEFDWLDRARRDCQLHFPVELSADIEKHCISYRLAQAPARKKTLVLCHVLRKDTDANFVLNAEDTRSQ